MEKLSDIVKKCVKEFIDNGGDILLFESSLNNYSPKPLSGWFFMRSHKSRYMINQKFYDENRNLTIEELIKAGYCRKYPL